MTQSTKTPSDTLLNAIELMLRRREEVGVKKYGETLDSSNKYDWKDMMIEELLDALMYASKLNKTLETERDNYKKLIDDAMSEMEKARNIPRTS